MSLFLKLFVAGKEGLVVFFLVLFSVRCVVDSRADRFDYEVNESEGYSHENRSSVGRSGAGKPSYNNGEIENDKYEMNRKLCKVRFYKRYIENEVAKRVYGREKQYMPEILRFKNLGTLGEREREGDIEDHNYECEIKARMTQKAFKFCEKFHERLNPPIFIYNNISIS